MVQNGAKYNRGLKRWELPPGSKPTARMGVQGGEGEDSIPPLGQKKLDKKNLTFPIVDC